jgi:small subunit ribosomal protein S16
MLKLRLKRYGRKKQACYRIVAINSKAKRDGKAIEELGFYNPLSNETHLKLNQIQAQLNNGAQPTATVKNILLKAFKGQKFLDNYKLNLEIK